MQDLKALVRQFYDLCLTVSPGEDPSRVAAVMGDLLADDFVSMGSVDSKGKAQLIGQVQHFWRLIPDLRWEPVDVLRDGDRVVVRSVASGSPKGEFMGLSLDGTRSFKVMTIDIHHVVDGRIKQVHHLEDWGTAIKQLSR